MTDQPIDRYPTSRDGDCPKGHIFRQTLDRKKEIYIPETCPSCDFEARRAALDAVLAKNSDLKGVKNGN